MDSSLVDDLNADIYVDDVIRVDETTRQLIDEVQMMIDFMFETGRCDMWGLLKALGESFFGTDNRFGDHDNDGVFNVNDDDYEGTTWEAGPVRATGGGNNGSFGLGIIMLPPWYGEIAPDVAHSLVLDSAALDVGLLDF